MSVDPRAEKFNIVGSDHGRMHKCDFSVFNWEVSFWGNLVKKIKIVSLSWNLVPALIRIYRIQWWYAYFLRFWLELPLFSKLGPKNQNCQFKLKFGRLIRICRIQWWFFQFIFSALGRKHPFWVNLIQKIKLSI